MKKQIMFSTVVFLMCCYAAGSVLAQQEVLPVEVNGDKVEFDIKERKVIASGNVSVVKGDTLLTCDRAEYYRDTQVAHAFGHVVLTRKKGQRIEGEELVFNFKTMQGNFDRPLLTMPPLYGSGDKVEKMEKDFFRVHNGYISTCDFDDPQWRVNAKTIDVYPGDVAIARNMVLRIGHVPIFYWPKYTEDLKERTSIVRFTPGYKSDWGGFLLSRWRFDRNKNFKTFIHLDERERKGFAWGVDNEYNTTSFGKGVLKTYYMNERTFTSGRIWDKRTSPVIEKERYKIEWRHHWQIDQTTSAVAQVYKLSDAQLLKDYFESEYEHDPNPNSYAVVTKGMTYGTLTARADFRMNRFMSTVDRLPEIGYSLPSLQIFDSNFYWKNSTTFSSLWQKNASPTDSYAKTKRVHVDNEISYPAKVSIIEARPFVGVQNTYYSRTKEDLMQNVVRSVFRTGVDLSTKFYRVYDKETNMWNLDIHKLRHVITPSIAYEYQDDPTITQSELDQYDAIDALDRVHKATFSLENKLQTKRDDKNVDLVRFILSTDYAFKQDYALPSGLNNIKADLEVTPYEWLGLYFDATQDPQQHQLVEANFDAYINNPDDIWFLRVGQRYHYEVGDQLETEVGWKLNPKWTLLLDQIFDFGTGKNARQDITIRRDLHSWIFDFLLSNKRQDGQEILFVFKLKGFDDVQLSGGRTFGGGSEKPGAQ